MVGPVTSSQCFYSKVQLNKDNSGLIIGKKEIKNDYVDMNNLMRMIEEFATLSSGTSTNALSKQVYNIIISDN